MTHTFNRLGSGAARLYYQKSKKQYYLLVSLEVEVPDPRPAPNVVGVDVGQRYQLVATDTRNQTLFISGKEARQGKNHYARKRRQLQAKGTRSATRRLITLSGRERRFMASHDHAVSKQLLTRYPNALLGLEDLTDIRARTEHRGKNPEGKQTARRTGAARPDRGSSARRRSQWSFARLQAFVAYKALLFGSCGDQGGRPLHQPVLPVAGTAPGPTARVRGWGPCARFAGCGAMPTSSRRETSP